jgi:hypothetical protein
MSLAADTRAAPLDVARDILRRTFGHADFRGLQAEVISEVLAGNSALAVLRPAAARASAIRSRASSAPASASSSRR